VKLLYHQIIIRKKGRKRPLESKAKQCEAKQSKGGEANSA